MRAYTPTLFMDLSAQVRELETLRASDNDRLIALYRRMNATERRLALLESNRASSSSSAAVSVLGGDKPTKIMPRPSTGAALSLLAGSSSSSDGQTFSMALPASLAPPKPKATKRKLPVILDDDDDDDVVVEIIEKQPKAKKLEAQKPKAPRACSVCRNLLSDKSVSHAYCRKQIAARKAAKAGGDDD